MYIYEQTCIMALSGYCRRHQDPTLGHRRPFELALARDMSERTAAAGAPPSPRRKLLPSSVLAVMLFFCAAAAATSLTSEERGGAAEERVEALGNPSQHDLCHVLCTTCETVNAPRLLLGG